MPCRWISKERGKEPNTSLFLWAKHNKGKHGIDEKVEDYLFEVSGKDGRLVEIYYPIFIVAPVEKKPVLIEYLADLGELEVEEELASFPCEVFMAILKVYENNGHSNWFATEDVREAFNEDRPDREKHGSRSIGRQIHQFGFKPHRSSRRKGYKWNEKLVQKLKERYPIPGDAYTPRLGAQTAQTSLEGD